MPHPLQNKIAILGITLLCVICLGGGVYLWKAGQDQPDDISGAATAQITKEAATASLRRFQQRMVSERQPSDTKLTLTELKSYLQSLPPELAAKVVRNFLQTGNDANTHLPFKVGKGGNLESPPTLRVALLDFIGDINPAAAEISRALLDTPTHPDEWAIALRNVARMDADAESGSYLHNKTEELINNPDWQATPSTGYYEAFDVLVHIKSSESSPLLSKLIRTKDRRDLNHAAFITLDRLTQKARPEMLKLLSEDKELHKSHPAMVAQQIARADLRDANQRATVKQWLIDPARTPDEIQAFVAIFPNHNQTFSNNLLSKNDYPTGLQLDAHDRAAKTILQSWLENPRMKHLAPYLNRSIARLEEIQPVQP